MIKQIVAIWAEDDNHLIGKDNQLPWRLPKELAHFKATTMGQVLLMGRVTFDGMGKRLLPGRETIILTTNQDYDGQGAIVLSSVQEVLNWYNNQDKSLFIVGGASIYKLFEPYYDMIIQTKVHHSFDGDTYLPEMDLSSFTLFDEEFFKKDDKNHQDFTIKRFKKKS